METGKKFVTEFDMPSFMIEPISHNLCLFLVLCQEEIDITQQTYEIPILVFDDDKQVKEMFIEGYIQSNAKSYIVDDINIDIVKNLLKNKNDGS